MAKLLYEFKNLRINEDGSLSADEMLDYTAAPEIRLKEYVILNPCTDEEAVWVDPPKEIFSNKQSGPKVTKIDLKTKTITFG